MSSSVSNPAIESIILIDIREIEWTAYVGTVFTAYAGHRTLVIYLNAKSNFGFSRFRYSHWSAPSSDCLCLWFLIFNYTISFIRSGLWALWRVWLMKFYRKFIASLSRFILHHVYSIKKFPSTQNWETKQPSIFILCNEWKKNQTSRKKNQNQNTKKWFLFTKDIDFITHLVECSSGKYSLEI